RASVTVQYPLVARAAKILLVDQDAQQFLHVAQSEIEALARQGVYSVRSVAYQCHPGRDHPAALQKEREGEWRTAQAQLAQSPPVAAAKRASRNAARASGSIAMSSAAACSRNDQTMDTWCPLAVSGIGSRARMESPVN